MQKQRIIGIDGYCYSSKFNYEFIFPKLNEEKIYVKYSTLLRRVFIILKKKKIKFYSNKNRIKLFEFFRNRIEKFCLLNFFSADFSIFYDLFNRLMCDIFFKLKLIKFS